MDTGTGRENVLFVVLLRMCFLFWITLCSGLAADSSGNIYVADSINYRIRRISPDGTVTTIAGTGERGLRDGKAKQAQFGYCYGIAVGEEGSLFVSDTTNHVIRRIKDGSVSTLAGRPGFGGFQDGKGEKALFDSPHGLCVDSDGTLLVADSLNHRIRRVSLDGVVKTFAGCGAHGDQDGTLAEAKFFVLRMICRSGGDFYVSDRGSDCVKKISGGKVTSLRGIEGPMGVAFSNGHLYTSSPSCQKVFRGEKFEIFAGTGQKGYRDGSPLQSLFAFPCGLLASNGCLYVSDASNHCIRRFTNLLEKWSPSVHHQTSKWMQKTVRTLLLMRRRRSTLWNGLPREILFLIFAEIHRCDCI